MQKKSLVIDIPNDCTPERAEQLLNAPYEDGYYLLRLHPTSSTCLRAFFVVRVKSGNRGAALANRDGQAAAALDVIRANPKLSSGKLARMLKALGIKRSKEWVREHRAEIVQADGGAIG